MFSFVRNCHTEDGKLGIVGTEAVWYVKKRPSIRHLCPNPWVMNVTLHGKDTIQQRTLSWGVSSGLRESEMPSQMSLQKRGRGTSLVVQWLRLHLPAQGVWFQSLFEELKSHMPPGQKKKKTNHKIETIL